MRECSPAKVMLLPVSKDATECSCQRNHGAPGSANRETARTGEHTEKMLSEARGRCAKKGRVLGDASKHRRLQEVHLNSNPRSTHHGTYKEDGSVFQCL